MSWVRTPRVPFARSFGVGLDMRYGDAHGFVRTDVPGGGSEELVADRVQSFLKDQQEHFNHAFFSFQPKDRSTLDACDYFPIWDRMLSDLPSFESLGLHHTQLNLGSIDAMSDRSRLFDFTNAMIERYDLRWVNEDVGIWSIAGKTLPYPLPPILSPQGLDAAVRTVDQVQSALYSPLVLEFPGFSEGSSFVVGELDAYDFFRELAQHTHSPVTLDTGHLLSYRWMRGCRGAALLDELDRLPLAHCFEVHLSGCKISNSRFIDLHHGVLLTEQLELLRALMSRCPNLRAVTYEDPKVDPHGHLPARARAPFETLKQLTKEWIGDASVANMGTEPASPRVAPSV